jgi:hypothetical protein
MGDPAPPMLGPWMSFYVMTGSSTAALIGLMFVVITLVTGEERLARNPDGISTFSTPTVVHFSAALFVSLMMAAPWHSLTGAAVMLSLAGLVGVAYVLRILNRARHLGSTYTPDSEDWTWYTVLPLVAYIAIAGGAAGLLVAPSKSLFALAGGAVLLIFVGIHNAWDIVTFLATGGPDRVQQQSAPQQGPEQKPRGGG